MDARSLGWRVSLCLSTLILAACGGGGGGSAGALPPAGGQSASVPGNAAPVPVAFSIAIPSATAPSGHARRLRYVSAGTKSVRVGYGGTQQTADCGATCAMTLAVVPGTITFDIGLYDAAGGAGHLLSHGVTTATVVVGQQNTVKVTFQGVVAKVAIALGTTSITAGTPATIPVTVTAQDSAGYTIVGSDPYDTPIALSTNDATGSVALSATSLAAPGAPVTLAYNGNGAVSAVSIGANAGSGVTVQPATLSVQPAPVPTAAPGTVPAHVATWYYYGLDTTNTALPASFMAAHADYVEDEGYTAPHAEAFKDAGGKYAVAYTDPAYVPYCSPPFTEPTGGCGGPIGDRVTNDASAWFHGADGTRLRRSDGQYYQDALNPAAPSARKAYADTTAAIVAAAPKLDFFFADDTGGPFNGPDGTMMSGWFYAFNAPAVEITTQAQFVTAERGMLASAVRPVIVNGADPGNMMPADNGVWLDSPNVIGASYEGCYSDGTGVAATHNTRWTLQSNALLANYAHNSKALCMLEAAATPSNRIYDMASWWMTYDPNLSIVAPMKPLADQTSVMPEFDIVPRQPLATATTNVSALSPAPNVYVREFAACYQAGQPIGGCAAIVNIGNSPAAMPALRGKYTAALAVDAASMYAGGKATWTGTVPASLGAISAVVIR